MPASIAFGVVLSETYVLTDEPITLNSEDTRADVMVHSFGDPTCPQHAVVLTSTLRRTSAAMTAGFREVTERERASVYAFCIRHNLRISGKHNLGDPTWLVLAHGVG